MKIFQPQVQGGEEGGGSQASQRDADALHAWKVGLCFTMVALGYGVVLAGSGVYLICLESRRG